MKRVRDNRNDPDILIQTYEGRIKNHKTKIKELKKLAKQIQKEIDKILKQPPTQTLIFANDYANRVEEIKEEIVSRKEQISDYRYDIRHLKKLLKKEKSESEK